MRESKHFTMKYDEKNDQYYLTNGSRMLTGSEIQSAAFAMESKGKDRKKKGGLHLPLTGLFHVKVAFNRKRSGITLPTS